MHVRTEFSLRIPRCAPRFINEFILSALIRAAGYGHSGAERSEAKRSQAKPAKSPNQPGWAAERSRRVSIRCGHNNARSSTSHDGRWLMTLLDPRTRNTHLVNGSSGFSFHLRDTELLVTAFPGCRTRFFLSIRMCHAKSSISFPFSPSLPFFSFPLFPPLS